MYILQLLGQSPVYAFAFLLSLVAAITVHECAHAWTAYRLGDDTPLHDGRVTLNPAAHLDPIGSLLFILVGFGWGRPVYYNPANLSKRSDELLVALAGPASNLLFALALNLIIAAVGGALPMYAQLLGVAAGVNVLLAAFNMIPIPPLDGSSIIAYFWPEYRSIAGGQMGLILLLVLIYLPIGPNGSLLSLVLGPIRSAFESATHFFGLIP